jgi:CRISPR-associated protein Cmr3
MDVWLFRDGRPFDAGSIHRAESMFPPYPSVIQGALRTHQLTIKNVDVNDKAAVVAAVGDANYLNGLNVRGPFVAKKQGKEITLYFPQPADSIVSVCYDSETKQEEICLKPASRTDKLADTLKTSQSLSLLGLRDESKKQSESFWLDLESLQKYLGGQSVKPKKADELFQREQRTGIGMTLERVVKEGMLYEAEFIRPRENIGLAIEMSYTEPEWDSGTLHLGGERRMAHFEQATISLPTVNPKIEKGAGFKVYFATPAFFNEGWKPAAWSKFFDGLKEDDLLAAAINCYETIGGFDWSAEANHENAHRPARRFVPAGSVYYFKNSGNVSLKAESITDYGAEIGFGQIIIKEW